MLVTTKRFGGGAVPFLRPDRSTVRFREFRGRLSSLATANAEADDAASTTTGGASTKVIPFLLADIGEGIAEVELLQWFVSPGDKVSQFDKVCEVQSDKATVEITSRYDGIVDSLDGAVGDMMPVGCPLMHIAVRDDGGGGDGEGGDGGGGGEGPTPATTLNNVDDEADRLHIPTVAASYPDFPTGPPEPPTPPPSPKGSDEGEEAAAASAKVAATFSGKKVLATPAVRRIGAEHGIDLGSILGTGPKGRVLKSDVLKLVRGKDRFAMKKGAPEAPPSSTARAEPPPPPAEERPTKAPPSSSPQFVPIPGEDAAMPIRGYGRQMVKTMSSSLSIPHMVYADDVNVTDLLALREKLKPIAESEGIKLSFLPFAIKALSLSLVKFPMLNSQINVDDMTLTYRGDHNVGIAMDTPRGLAVPVVKRCQNLTVLDVARELNRLQELASEGNLSEEDITDATFTLSNIGAIGGKYMSPIISPPQVAIGALGKIERVPRFVARDSLEVEAVHVMGISWAGDHRAVEGAKLGRFSNRWKEYMESPALMMFDMK